MNKKIFLILAALMLCNFTWLESYLMAGQDTSQVKSINSILYKINELDKQIQANNEVLARKIIYDPLSRKMFVLNEPNLSIDIIDNDGSSEEKPAKSIDLSIYGGKAACIAFGSGILGVLMTAENGGDKFLCISQEGILLKTFLLDSLMQGAYYNASGKQFMVYSTDETGYSIFSIDLEKKMGSAIPDLMNHYHFRIKENSETASGKMQRSDPVGILMTIIAMTVVFFALILLYLVFKYTARLYTMDIRKRFLKRKGRQEEVNSLPDIHDTTNELGAAIGLALYYYQNQLHDNENTVLTIQKVARIYSPWSSKIYGIGKIIK